MDVKIEYVGAKVDGERAFKEETGIEWFPGDVHPVDLKIAEKMLRHPDVFKAADAKASLGAAKAPETVKSAETGNADPLAGLDDKGVRAYAKAHGVTIGGLNFKKGDELRAVVTKALAEKK